MIVVVGPVAYRESTDGPGAGGVAARIALAAAALGNDVQFVGKVGEDDWGDAVVLALAAGGVGHVAVLREAGRPTPRSGVEPDAPSDPDAARIGPAAQPPAVEPTGVGPMLDPADVDLALRYLTDFKVLVQADLADPDIAAVAARAVAWVEGRLIVVVPRGEAVPAGLPDHAIVFEAPDDDPDDVFARLVGAFAVALDDGDEPAEAFRSTVAAEGWTPAADDPGEAATPA